MGQTGSSATVLGHRLLNAASVAGGAVDTLRSHRAALSDEDIERLLEAAARQLAVLKAGMRLLATSGPDLALAALDDGLM